MGNKYTDFPKHKGENDVAHQLSGMTDDKTHLWFSLDSLPGVKDIDMLILDERHGCFAVEIKAVPLSMIERLTDNRCKIEGRPEGLSPQKQAHEAMFNLFNYLKPRNVRVFIVATACFPRIKRSDWNAAFRGTDFCGNFAERIIFREDLYSTPDVFESRLAHIYKNPPCRGGAQRNFNFNKQSFDKLVRALSPDARPKITESDFSRLQAIEKNVTRNVLKDAPAGDAKRIVYKGRPGTGKTFRLLQIGMHHAANGQSILFICFNKTLASDIRRLVSYSDVYREVEEHFEIVDIFQLASRYFQDLDIRDDTQGYDEWGEMIVDELVRSDDADIPAYNTVLIDEAQDMNEWQIRFAELHVSNTSTACIALGKGQELYFNYDGEHAADSWLLEDAEAKQLRRNFRNTKPLYEFAYCFFEAQFKLQKVDQLADQIKGRRNAEINELEFSRSTGSLPEIAFINEDDLPSPGDSMYGLLQNELMVCEYRRLIERELELLGDGGFPLDLLILVPSGKRAEQRWAEEALKQLAPEIGFIDYTNPEFRRQIPQETMVRLCTFHSSRGLEGNRVLVFGIEWIQKMAENRDINPANLGYVTLSRALFDTTIAIRSSISNSTIEYLLKIRQALSD